jgi:2-iminobutanoate/2-iminopropanoate deaminase
VRVNIYLTDMSNFGKIVALRQKWFRPPYPADTIVEVRSLALPELMIEIEVTALARGRVQDAKPAKKKRAAPSKRTARRARGR